MKPCLRKTGVLAALLFAMTLLAPHPVHAYAVLSHEEVVDMTWKEQLVPMLKSRFPSISDDEIRQAHAYAYGGSVIQDIGYYPFGSHYFSDLLHYTRSGDFVEALLRDSSTPEEYAFALGALAHFCGDSIGHPYINQVTSDENPMLRQRYGTSVTYAEDPTAHLRTEFGFDVVEVAHGHYSQENYRDFVGFQVTKPLLERAFLETYGIPMSDIIKHEDLAISTYRKAVSSLIPEMTKIAYVNYKSQIQEAAPGVTKKEFLYRLDQTEYNKSFGTDYTRVGLRGRLGAFLLRLMPKVGPLKGLKLHIPNGQEQVLYLASINKTVDNFRMYLAEVHATPAPVPPPDPADATAARKAADKLAKDADKYKKLAEKTKDPSDQVRKDMVADNVQKAADKADASASRTEAKVAAASLGGRSPAIPGALPPGTPIKPPTTPVLPQLDLDTGMPSTAGEYELADKTYAHLLHDLIEARADPSSSAGTAGKRASLPVNREPVKPVLAAAIERFFAHRVARTGPPPTPRQAKREAALAQQVHADLATLRKLESTSQQTRQGQ